MNSKEPLSGYAEFAGGVSAFGGLGRDFGHLGRLGVLGKPSTPAPAGTTGQPIGLLLALTKAS